MFLKPKYTSILIALTIFSTYSYSFAELGPEYCIRNNQNSDNQLFYRQMVIKVISDRIYDYFDDEVVNNVCFPLPTPLNDPINSPGRSIEYTNWVCTDDNGVDEWVKWNNGFSIPASISPADAEQMSTITSPEPPDAAMCTCFLEYLAFDKSCQSKNLGRAVWNYDTCTGVCCQSSDCFEHQIKGEDNLGLPKEDKPPC